MERLILRTGSRQACEAIDRDRRHSFGSLLPLMLGLVVAAGCSSGGEGPPPMPPPTVTVSTPIKKQIVEWDSYTGRLEPCRFVEVRARVSGYLQTVHFSDGQMVEQGDLLFVIDPRPFKAALESAEAALVEATAQAEKAEATKLQAEALLEKADANLTLADRRLKRAQSLKAQNATAQESVDTREAEYDQAQADVQGAKAGIAEANAAIANAKAAVETARANVRTASIDLSYTIIRAPIAGRISDHRVTNGNLISGGSAQSTLLTTITSLDPIYCTFDASEAEVLKYIRLSQSGERQTSRDKKNPVYLSLADEEGFPHWGHMDFVDNRFNPNSATLRAKAILPNLNNDLVPGLFATIRIPGSGTYEAVLIPDEAIGTDQAEQFVMIIDEASKAQRVGVELGPIVGGLRVIRKGLTGNERVVTRGLQRIQPDTIVEVEVAPLEVLNDGLPDSYEPVPPEKWLSLPPAPVPPEELAAELSPTDTYLPNESPTDNATDDGAGTSASPAPENSTHVNPTQDREPSAKAIDGRGSEALGV